MSTSPDERRLFRRTPSKRPIIHIADLDRPRRKPSALRGLIWLAVWVGLIVLIVNFPELITDYLWHGIELVLEVAEQSLDIFYEMVGLSHAIAPIATAYTGLMIALVLLYFLVRKSIVWYRGAILTYQDYKTLYTDLSRSWWERLKQRALDWWDTLDWMHRIAVIVFLILIGIPLALLLSFILGTAVASLF